MEEHDEEKMQQNANMKNMPGMGAATKEPSFRDLPANDKAKMPGMSTKGAMPAGGMMMHGANLKRRFFVCLVLTLPVLLLSAPMGLTLPFVLWFPGSDWLVAALATVLYFYGGMPFLRGAVSELKRRRPAMMTLITLGITTAYAYSLYAFIVNNFLPTSVHVTSFFWELSTLVVIMLLGHWVEMKAVMGAGDALKEMAALLPSQAHVKQVDGTFADVSIDSLQIGQIAMVEAGEKIPADGRVQEGVSAVDEALVTGEARKVSKAKGDAVFGGSQNDAGTLYVRITGTGSSGYLAQVMQLVQQAQQDKSHAEVLSDKVSRWLFYAAAGAGVVAFAVWFVITGSMAEALSRMVTVLVIACPHALGLAIPLVAARSTSLGARHGLLVRRRRALEAAARVNVVMMDKTGTLTEGDFRVVEVADERKAFAKGAVMDAVGADGSPATDDTSATVPDFDSTVLAIMAGLEQSSSHPLAASIVRTAQQRKVEPVSVRDVKAVAGVGVQGVLAEGQKVSIVNARYLNEQKMAYDQLRFDTLTGRGLTVSYLVVDGLVRGMVAQGDQIKPAARKAVQDLKTRGITTVMLTGDNDTTAQVVARELGIDEVFAKLMPSDKAQLVQQRREAGNVVMMVGDGINDAPSLAGADVGVAIGAGTDVAIDSADVVLVKSNPADLVRLISLAKNTTRKIVQNLWWGGGYNIVAIPLAAGVLAPFGIILNPAMGAVLMSLSTIIVAINAITLKD